MATLYSADFRVITRLFLVTQLRLLPTVPLSIFHLFPVYFRSCSAVLGMDAESSVSVMSGECVKDLQIIEVRISNSVRMGSSNQGSPG